MNVGVGYAISINQIKNFLGVLHSGRIVDHATLGATVDSDDDGRVVVSEILETSDAYRRGLRCDDEIVSFAGRPISTPNGFKNVLGIFPKGWRVPLSYRRDGKRYDVLVRLAGVHGEEELLEKAGGASRQPSRCRSRSPARRRRPPKADAARQGRQAAGEDAASRRAPPSCPLPEVVKKHFQEKRGFANYYFNTLNQQRVWKAWNAAGEARPARGAWTLSGPLESGGAVPLPNHRRRASRLKLPSAEHQLDGRRRTGRVAVAGRQRRAAAGLYLWRRLATEGLGRFGDVYYYGTAPLPGRAGLADVLVGSHKGVECRFYFDPGRRAICWPWRCSPTRNRDPCEIYFSDYRETAGRVVPGPHGGPLRRRALRRCSRSTSSRWRSAEGGAGSENCKIANCRLQTLRQSAARKLRGAGSRSAAFADLQLSFCSSILSLFASRFLPPRPPRWSDDDRPVQPKIVKIYGAGGFRGMEAYQSGILDFARGPHPDRLQLRARHRLHHACWPTGGSSRRSWWGPIRGWRSPC